jgi:hypothetical protein
MEQDRNENYDGIVHNFVQKSITRLFKSFLDINNEIKVEHEIMLGKVSSKTSKDFTENIDYFTTQKSEYFRKKILDSGNECIREIDCLLEAFDMNLNEKKLEKYLNSKKIIKTRIFSGTTITRTIHKE